MTPSDTERLRDALRALAANRQDDDAWRALITITFPIALATANWVVRGALDLAKDATWDAFARIARYAELELFAVAAPAAFIRYLKQVTRRAAYDLLRSLARRAPEIQAGLVETEIDSTGDEPTPEEMLAAAELSAEIRAMLSEDEQRLYGMLLEGFTLREIAEKRHISYQAAGVRVFRIRQRIKKYLGL
jgi:RNA polymerase sigma factor (sigma-70 family)